jgi:hypothetical protein
MVNPLPFVKQWTPGIGQVRLVEATVATDSPIVADEAAFLEGGLRERGVGMAAGAVSIRLEIATVAFPLIESRYREEIERQGYRLTIAERQVRIQARAPAGIFYGIQTLFQMLNEDRVLPQGVVLDWPDLATRMVMIDSARQNENADYYARLIRFLARYKVNRLHWHLTDDETVALYHEDYPWLLHPHAWKPEPIRDLLALAQRHHIEVIPEIESLGHARVFARHPDYRDILHETTFDKPSKSWAGTEVPGFTNVLCPASEKSYAYLSAMYARAAEVFPGVPLHIGCDEVESTTCARCDRAFPGISRADWFRRHLLKCRELVAANGRPTALWGDMLLHHPEVMEGLPRGGITVYDWHYNGDVAPDSAALFKQAGFEVIACPALVCHPRLILPDAENFANILRFTQIARELDLRGVDTTIWTPTRYLSDVLWPGIGYAAVQAWSGSQWNEGAFYAAFARDFFGMPEGAAFAAVWKDLCGIRWWLDDFNSACWVDEPGCTAAQAVADRRAEEIRGTLERLRGIQETLGKVGAGVRREHVAWAAIERSAALRAYTMRHLLASREACPEGRWNLDVVRSLDDGCVEAIGWIEADWDRNAFADDPNKDGAYQADQNVLHRFRQMHAFHQRILRQTTSSPTTGP